MKKLFRILHCKIRWKKLLKISILFLLVPLFLGQNVIGQSPTPFSCGPQGILTQSDPLPAPSDLQYVNMSSGDVTTVETLTAHVNGIGYNVQDDFIYGIDRGDGSGTNGIVRIGANGNLVNVAGPAVINGRNPVVGDVDDNGHYWTYAGAANEWIQVDLTADPVVQIGSGTPGTTGGLDLTDYENNIVDWSFVPGTNSLYAVASVTDGSEAHLLSFNRSSKEFSLEANLGDLGDTNTLGATYVDSDNILYASNNGTGVIWRIEVNDPSPTATQFTQGPTTSQNDGARCYDASIPIDITLTIGPCWRMLSSPIDGLTYADMLDDLWIQGVPGADYEGGTPNVYTWPEGQSGDDPANWEPLADLTDPIPPGSGFLISVFEDDNYDGTIQESEEFDKIITLSGPGYTDDISPTLNSTSDGWSIVGNPFAQSIDAVNLFTNDLTDIVYIWDRNAGSGGDWVTYDTGTGTGDIDGGLIAPGQGFFVQNVGTDPPSPSLTFPDNNRTLGATFYGKQKDEEDNLQDYVRLEVNGESLTNSAWIRFSGEGSEDPVYGDALELQPLSEQYALFGSRKADGTLSDIGHFPMPTDDLKIPVHLDATQPGTYNITATDLDLPPGSELYLHDLETGESVPITSSLNYSFAMEQRGKNTPDSDGIVPCSASPEKAKTTGLDRFLISTTQDGGNEEIPQKVMLEQNYPNPFNPSTVITYELPQSSNVHLEIFDMVGRQVATLVDGAVEAGDRH